MLSLEFAGSFKKDFKKIEKTQKDLKKLWALVNFLIHEQKIPIKYKLHKIKGNWKGHYECHIEPDWLLIYRYDRFKLILVRTGSHAQLLKI